MIGPYIWGLSNRIAQQLLNFINTVVLAHFLSPEDFGKVGVLAIFISLATTIADTGMGGSIVKEKNLTLLDCSTVFSYNLTFSVVLYAILFLCAPVFETFFHIEGLSEISRLVTLPIIINAITIVPRSLCVRDLRFDRIFFVTVSASVISMVVSILLAVNGFGVWALVCYSILCAFIENIGFHIVCKYLPRFGFSVVSFKKLFSFGLFTALSTVVDTIYENILSVLIGRRMGAIEVGYYSQAKRIEEAPSKSISTTVGSVAFPSLSRYSDDKVGFVKKAKSLQNTLISLSMPVMLLISIYARPVITVLFGDKWIDAAPYLSILCIAGLFAIIENTNRTFLKSLGRSDIMFKASIIKRSIGLLIIFIALKYGVSYLLWAYVLTSAISAVINSIFLSKQIDYSFWQQMLSWARFVLPGVILYLINYVGYATWQTWWSALICIVVSIVCFYMSLQLCGVREISRLIVGLTIKKTL